MSSNSQTPVFTDFDGIRRPDLSSLNGLYITIFSRENQLERRGQVLGQGANYIMVQWLDPATGQRDAIECIQIDKVMSEQTKFFLREEDCNFYIRHQLQVQPNPNPARSTDLDHVDYLSIAPEEASDN